MILILYFFKKGQVFLQGGAIVTNAPLSNATENSELYCVKSVRIRSFSGPYFLAFGLNTERYSVSLRIQFECKKIRTRKILNTDTFYRVLLFIMIKKYIEFILLLLSFCLATPFQLTVFNTHSE